MSVSSKISAYKILGIFFALVLSQFHVSARAEIFFMSRTIGPSTNIYSTNEHGRISKITDDSNWRDLQADISSTGRIVFMSNRKDKMKIDLHKTSDTFNIFSVNKDSREVMQITQGQGTSESPVLSPNGKFIAYLRKKDASRELIVTGIDGKNPRSILSAPTVLDFAWSADGERLAYVILRDSESILGSVEMETGNTHTLLSVSLNSPKITREQIASAQWSPDGKKIAYITSALNKNARYLNILDVATGKSTKISPDNMHVQSPVDWSDDSKKILYSALVDYQFLYDERAHRKVYKGSMQVFLTDLTGNRTQLTSGDFLHKRPVFSPDEKKIAYFFAPDLGARTLALITMKLDGSGKRQLYDKVSSDSILEWL